MNVASMTRHRRCARAIPVLLTALLFSGCAALEFAWRFVDGYLVSEVDEWVDLEADQEDRLQARLQPWLEQVRRDELPRLAALLRDTAHHVENGFDFEDTRRGATRLADIYRDTLRGFIPLLAPTLADLGPDQLAYFEQRLREHNEAYRARYVDGRGDGRYALAERMIEGIERWTGPLEPRQRALVHDDVRTWPQTSEEWSSYRARMQKRLLAHLAADVPVHRIEHTLVVWWVEQGARPAAERHRTAALQESVLRTLVRVGRSLSLMQRADAARRMRGWARSFESVAARD